MINILIVDDHLIVREGIKRIINDTPDMQIISEAGSGQEAINLICNNKFYLSESIKKKLKIFRYNFYFKNKYLDIKKIMFLSIIEILFFPFQIFKFRKILHKIKSDRVLVINGGNGEKS